MAKKKAKPLGLFGTLFLLATVAGLVLAIVGVCLDFFTVIGDKIGLGLFSEALPEELDLPIALIQAFAIISVVLTGLACVVTVLGSFGIIQFGGLKKWLFVALVVAAAVIVSVFSATYDTSIGLYSAAVGPYLVMVGGIVSGAGMFLANLRR